MNYSFWEKKFIESPTDITIIGSGIVGISTALSLKKSHTNMTIKVLERGPSPYGASTKNAGFSCFGSVSELLDDIQKMGEHECMNVVKMRFDGLQKLKSRVGLSKLEYRNSGGTELFRLEDEELISECVSQVSYCNQLMHNYLGIENCYSIQKNENFENFQSTTIFNAHEGCINPVSMMNELIKQAVSKGINFVNGIEVLEIDAKRNNLTTSGGLNIEFKKLIVCTNGFTNKLLPGLNVVPARNQVLVTEPSKDLKLPSCYHMDKGYIYFREVYGRILLGGARNMDLELEQTADFGNTKVIQDYLLNFLKELYPSQNLKVDHWWSGIMGIGDSKYPICEWHNNDVLVGVRLGGMGVAIGSFLGQLLSDKMIQAM
jgi:glycine/D-amino acid oxidase-like deaminating enzyme